MFELHTKVAREKFQNNTFWKDCELVADIFDETPIQEEQCSKKYPRIGPQYQASLKEEPQFDSFNILHTPEFTSFPVVKRKYIRHSNFIDKNNIFTLDAIHLRRPKVNIESQFDPAVPYYIEKFQNLFGISENDAKNIIKKYDGDIYKAIILG